MQRTRIPLLALIAVLSVAAAACGNDDNDSGSSSSTSDTAAEGTVTKTIEIAFEGEVDDPADRMFAVTYFYSAELDPAGLASTMVDMFGSGGDPPDGFVMGVAGMCGPDGYGDKLAKATGFTAEPVVEQPCTNDGAPFEVALELPAGAALHYSLEAGLVSDLENVETFGGNHVGDPNDPPAAEDAEVVDSDDTTSYTYEFAGTE